MTIKMKAPEGLASLSIDGNNYPVKDGILIVPRQFMETALEHGFMIIDTVPDLVEEKEHVSVEKKVKSNTKKVD